MIRWSGRGCILVTGGSWTCFRSGSGADYGITPSRVSQIIGRIKEENGYELTRRVFYTFKLRKL
ncbi:hypothetical protein DRO42_05675 [Candidatus Bathyarchaeota archaeon]|nr:MAG: hypothetical protein DRO42_05675 [Candidatus Bathyarchaeota archaeon]